MSRVVLALLVLVTQVACTTPRASHAPTREEPARAPRYAQTLNSAMDGCLRNPGCVVAAPGEEALIPWLSRTLGAARTASAIMQVLDSAEVTRVEQLLVECAQTANTQVNEREYGPGNRPSDAECDRVIRFEGTRKITRAMELGTMKHQEALACVERELGPRFPGHFTLEPTYKLDPATKQWVRLEPQWVAKWVTERLFDLLLGTRVPDVVLHASGNPNAVQRVYDFKFPCLAKRREDPLSDDAVQLQLEKYRALGGDEEPAIVTPQLGISR